MRHSSGRRLTCSPPKSVPDWGGEGKKRIATLDRDGIDICLIHSIDFGLVDLCSEPVVLHTGPIATPLKSKFCLPMFVDRAAFV